MDENIFLNKENEGKIILFERPRKTEYGAINVKCIGKITGGSKIQHFILEYKNVMYIDYDVIKNVRFANSKEIEIFNSKMEHAYDAYILEPLDNGELRDYPKLYNILKERKSIEVSFDDDGKKYKGILKMNSSNRIFLYQDDIIPLGTEIPFVRNRIDYRNVLQGLKWYKISYKY